jgi:hypothetical protein
MNRFLVVSTLVVLGLSASACSASQESLRARAAYDLSCPASSISTAQFDQTTPGASGCGRHATYIEFCGLLRCTWFPESVVTSLPRP